MLAESIALNRFGLGARPGDQPPADPRRWLLSQLDTYEVLPAPWQPLPRTPMVAAEWVAQQRALRQAPEEQRAALREAHRRKDGENYRAAIGARLATALQSPAPFAERLVHFWANHFAVSVDKGPVTGFAGSFELDAIRPHILGRFEDLLLAAVRHPAMLVYLDQERSIGPDSPAGRRARLRQRNNGGLNENLAREILELHTLGVRSGYSQDDVTEFARALTGWTLPDAGGIGADAPAPVDSFRFAPYQHEPGERRVLGRRYAPAGEEQGRAILRDLAAAPATADHIALKLARHFVADEPPASLVLRLSAAFRNSGGHLPTVYRELVLAPETWAPGPGKFKSPWDWAVSSLRALERRALPPQQAANLMNQLGQPVWRPGSPAGWGDVAGAWAAPDALLRRVEVAQRFGAQGGAQVDARLLAPRVLPGLADGTRQAIARSDSPATALALLLASPDFLRR
jgi:uncharacterized protein (DUF1800 family)